MPRNIGEFAGSFADAFTRIRAQNADQKRQDEMAKLQGKLTQLHIEAADRKGAAQTDVSNLMEFGTTTPQTSPGGRGLLQPNLGNPGEEVPDARPGLGANELLDSPEGLSAMLASGQLEPLLALAQENRLQDQFEDASLFREQFGGFFTNNNTDSAGNDQFIFLPQADSEGNFGVQAVLNPNYTIPVTEAEGSLGMQSKFTDVQETIKLGFELDEVSGPSALLRSGSPFGGLAEFAGAAVSTGAQAFGLEGGDIEKNTNKRKSLSKKLAANLLTGPELDELSEKGPLSNDKIRALRASSADLNNGAVVNAGILVDHLEGRLELEKIQGRTPANEKEIRDYISNVRKMIAQQQGGEKNGRFIIEEVP